MTSKEFVSWLQGFLDATDDLTVEGVEFIKNKMKEISDPPPGCDNYPLPPNIYPPLIYNHGCPSGGDHEYPDMWHGILPPPCKKCGQFGPSFNIYCSSNETMNCINNSGQSYVEFEVPIKHNPDVNMVDGTYSLKIEVQDPTYPPEDLKKIPIKPIPENLKRPGLGGEFMLDLPISWIEGGTDSSAIHMRDCEFEVKPEYREQFNGNRYIRFKNTPENVEKYRNFMANPPEAPHVATQEEASGGLSSKPGREFYKDYCKEMVDHKERLKSQDVRDKFKEGYVPIKPVLDYLKECGVEQRVIFGLEEHYLFHKNREINYNAPQRDINLTKAPETNFNLYRNEAERPNMDKMVENKPEESYKELLDRKITEATELLYQEKLKEKGSCKRTISRLSPYLP